MGFREEDVREDPALREMHLGAFQGRTASEAQRSMPAEWARYRTEPRFAVPGGGESLDGFTARCSLALTRIASAHVGETVCVVTHGGVLDAARRTWFPRERGADRCGNTGVCVFVWAPDEARMTLRLWNCLKHLEDADYVDDARRREVLEGGADDAWGARPAP